MAEVVFELREFILGPLRVLLFGLLQLFGCLWSSSSVHNCMDVQLCGGLSCLPNRTWFIPTRADRGPCVAAMFRNGCDHKVPKSMCQNLGHSFVFFFFIRLRHYLETAQGEFRVHAGERVHVDAPRCRQSVWEAERVGPGLEGSPPSHGLLLSFLKF